MQTASNVLRSTHQSRVARLARLVDEPVEQRARALEHVAGDCRVVRVAEIVERQREARDARRLELVRADQVEELKQLAPHRLLRRRSRRRVQDRRDWQANSIT